MATNKPASGPAFIQYGNAREREYFQEALKADYKVNSKMLGYPNKDEIDGGILDNATLSASNTISAIPRLIGDYLHDEHRALDLPAPDDKTAAASLKLVAVDEKTKTGIIQLGDKKGQEYTSTIAAHEEFRVKSKNGTFKK